MADHVITLTAEQEKCLPLRDNGNGLGGETDFESIADFCTRTVTAVADQCVSQQRQRDYDALTVAEKDAAIALSKIK